MLLPNNNSKANIKRRLSSFVTQITSVPIQTWLGKMFDTHEGIFSDLIY